MRDRYDDFIGRGAEIVGIGLGTPDEARAFATRFHIPFPVLADPHKLSYRAVSLHRASLNQVIGPPIWRAGIRALTRGRGMTLPKQDPLQLGGTAVILAGGRIAYMHQNADSADDPPIDELLEALA